MKPFVLAAGSPFQAMLHALSPFCNVLHPTCKGYILPVACHDKGPFACSPPGRPAAAGGTGPAGAMGTLLLPGAPLPPPLCCAAKRASRADTPGSAGGTMPDITPLTTCRSLNATLCRVCGGGSESGYRPGGGVTKGHAGGAAGTDRAAIPKKALLGMWHRTRGSILPLFNSTATATLLWQQPAAQKSQPQPQQTPSQPAHHWVGRQQRQQGGCICAQRLQQLLPLAHRGHEVVGQESQVSGVALWVPNLVALRVPARRVLRPPVDGQRWRAVAGAQVRGLETGQGCLDGRMDGAVERLLGNFC